MLKRSLLLILIFVLAIPFIVRAQGETTMLEITSGDIEIVSGGQAYQSYLAAPTDGGPYPGIVLVHSFRGLEQGYRTLSDQFAARGFVVLAIGWQTFEQAPPDATV